MNVFQCALSNFAVNESEMASLSAWQLWTAILNFQPSCYAESFEPMSVLLQSMETAKYVQRSDSWTETPDEARKFGGAMEALFYCYHHHLENMRILGEFGDPERDFSIPLRQIGVRASDARAVK